MSRLARLARDLFRWDQTDKGLPAAPPGAALGRPGVQRRLQLAQPGRVSLHFAAASARRHRFVGIPDTRNRAATSRSPARTRSAPRRQPGPLRGGQPAAIGIPHDTGIQA